MWLLTKKIEEKKKMGLKIPTLPLTLPSHQCHSLILLLSQLDTHLPIFLPFLNLFATFHVVLFSHPLFSPLFSYLYIYHLIFS